MRISVKEFKLGPRRGQYEGSCGMMLMNESRFQHPRSVNLHLNGAGSKTKSDGRMQR